MNTTTFVMLATLAVLVVFLHGPPPQSAEPGRLVAMRSHGQRAGGGSARGHTTFLRRSPMNTTTLVMLATLAVLAVF